MTTPITFASLELDQRIIDALDAAGYTEPTEIQEEAIPIALAGKDILASAQTGTGKTAAFTLPILQQMYKKYLLEKKDEPDQEEAPKGKKRRPQRTLRGLILTPTRELAQQIEESVTEYGKFLPFKARTFVGGLPIGRQIEDLKKGIDIAVATPGRLLDLLNRKALRLDTIEYFVLDEADRMLDMGFVQDVKDIAKRVSKNRQTMLFSATMSSAVTSLSRELLKDPQSIAVQPDQSFADNVEQKVFFVDQQHKRDLLFKLLSELTIGRALIFTTTKASANVLANQLAKKGISSDAIHSDKNQNARQKALKDFDEGKTKILVATDVVARGIDVDGITHVINYEMPTDAESYVHRIGRTARAGASGVAISLCDMHEVGILQLIQSLTGQEIEADFDQPYHSPLVQTMSGQGPRQFGRGGNRRRRFPRKRRA